MMLKNIIVHQILVKIKAIQNDTIHWGGIASLSKLDKKSIKNISGILAIKQLSHGRRRN